ncbi:fructosamine kinase family protein [Streptomyces odontomachi]|uniref:fructosamine kinase family protein n=1 Tax=Streptomyces odontomachi TaxID=2944940 RepID=UPI00210D4A24|nr:fructosamine kinase family protein [Streptomyces sp. ODS25]
MLNGLRDRLRADGLDDDVVEADVLTGGVVNTVSLVTWRDGTRRVVKYAPAAPDGLYRCEAEGLAVLGGTGGLAVPEVCHVSDRLLMMKELRPLEDVPAGFWEAAGRAVAALHTVRGERHGWPQDGWLGLLPQENAWCDDGHEFFATRRILRYLPEPQVQETLTAADRAAIERICDRLPELVPPTPPVLTHGDLWRGNVMMTAGGHPAFIDPAVSWTWPDVDLSMFLPAATPDERDRFFGAYREVHPLGDGWRDRLRILNLREMLSTLAHEGNRWGTLDHIRQVTAPFAST